MIIYLAMAIDFPAWALDAVDKIRKGFRKETNRGALPSVLGKSVPAP
jgi:hypothetical protein